jgi:hypothetical protein
MRIHNVPFFIVQSCAESLVINVCARNPPFFLMSSGLREEENPVKIAMRGEKLFLAKNFRFKLCLPS